MRDVLLGLRHALADDLHHAGRLDELRPRLPRRLGEPRGLEALHLGLFGLRRLRRLDVGLPVGLLGATALDRRPHVALDDAARGSRAFYLGEVEVVLLRQPSNYRRGAEVTVGSAVGLGLGGRLLSLGGLGLRGGLGPTAGFAVAPFFGLLALGGVTGCSLRHVLALALDKCYGPADGMSCPSSAMSWASVPAFSASSSSVTLSVSISAIASPSETSSPSLFSHLTRVPSSIASPILGMITSGILLLLHVKHPAGRIRHLLLAREGRKLQIPRVRRRDLRPAHPLHRGVQIIKGPVLDDRRDLARDSEPPPLLLYRHRPVRLLDGLDDGVLVERPDGPEVYDLGADAIFLF